MSAAATPASMSATGDGPIGGRLERGVASDGVGARPLVAGASLGAGNAVEGGAPLSPGGSVGAPLSAGEGSRDGEPEPRGRRVGAGVTNGTAAVV